METYSGTTTLTNCTVTGNSARFNGGGVVNFGSRHDHANQLHYQWQLRRQRGRAAQLRPSHGHTDQLQRQRQLRGVGRRPGKHRRLADGNMTASSTRIGPLTSAARSSTATAALE